VRKTFLAATALCSLLTNQAYAGNDIAGGIAGGIVGGILGGIISNSQQQQLLEQQRQQQQIQQQQQQYLLQQQQIEADRQRAAQAAAQERNRQKAEAARQAKAAADKAKADAAASTAATASQSQPAQVQQTTATITTSTQTVQPPVQPTVQPVDAPQPAALPVAAPQPVIAQTTQVVVALTADAAETRGMITMYKAIIDEQQKMAADDPNLSDVANQAIAVLGDRIKTLQALFLDKTTELSRYRTSIKPNDPDLQITPRKASELYPKVPYYIPGTPESGEFWVEPVVSEVGELEFNLRFIDPKAEHDKTRGSILLSVAEAEVTQKALMQVVKWAKVAHEQHIRRTYSQRASCFPDDKCPVEGQKREGAASTEIDFKIYDDGSTAARIQRNKGRFEEGYNISIDSASMLQAYVKHILSEGKTDFESGSRTDEQMRSLFK
jgi:hypothetical protein